MGYSPAGISLFGVISKGFSFLFHSLQAKPSGMNTSEKASLLEKVPKVYLPIIKKIGFYAKDL